LNVKKETYFCLPLEIIGISNINKSLENLLKPELLTGENKILCELCDKTFSEWNI